MPLSEHEQRLLEQMERALYAEDPKFASSLRGRNPRSNFRRRVFLASVGFIVGVVLLMAGLWTIWVVSVIGFLLMLVSAFFGVTSYRAAGSAAQLGIVDATGVRPPRTNSSRSGGRRPRSSSAGRATGQGFMARMEERWNRRRDENGR